VEAVDDGLAPRTVVGTLLGVTPDLVRTSRSQGGCFTWEQAQRLGITTGELRYAVDRGHIERVLPRVYVFAGAPRDIRMHSYAALLQYGPEAALSHGSAGARWGMTPTPLRVTITIPHDHKRWLVRQPWLRVHRTRHPDLVTLHNAPVTSRPRTLIDLGSLLTAATGNCP
jgi:predicted transcriptional regulator of viral defense system